MENDENKCETVADIVAELRNEPLAENGCEMIWKQQASLSLGLD